MPDDASSKEAGLKHVVTAVSTAIALVSGILSLYKTLRGDTGTITFLLLLVAIAGLAASIGAIVVRRIRPEALRAYPSWLPAAAWAYAVAFVLVCGGLIFTRQVLLAKIDAARAEKAERPAADAAWADVAEAKTLLAASVEDPRNHGAFDLAAERRLADALQRVAQLRTSWSADARDLERRLREGLPAPFAIEVRDLFEERHDRVRLYRFLPVMRTVTSGCHFGLQTCDVYYDDAGPRAVRAAINAVQALYVQLAPAGDGAPRVVAEPDDRVKFQTVTLLRWKDGVALSYLGTTASFGEKPDRDWWEVTRIGPSTTVRRSIAPQTGDIGTTTSPPLDDLRPAQAARGLVTAVSPSAVDVLDGTRTYHARWVPDEGRFAITASDPTTAVTHHTPAPASPR
jgi:hypothetical protein